MKPTALALMGAASFCAGVWHKRYSGQQERAPSFDRTDKTNRIIN
ncbi:MULTISPECIES: hypothetical protein [Flavobacterium]|nr:MULTISPECIES: hypothetical protein [Flavobacterium]